MAIEDAAVLANSLWRAGLGRLQLDAATMNLKIDEALKEYSTRLQGRTRQMCERSEFLVRLQTHDGLIKHFLAKWVIPILGDVPASLSARTIRSGPLIEFLEPPLRSCQRAKSPAGPPAWIAGSRLFLSAFLACAAMALQLFKIASGNPNRPEKWRA